MCIRDRLSQERVPAPGKHAVCERLHVEVFSVCNGQEKRPKCAYFFCFLRVFLLAWYGELVKEQCRAQTAVSRRYMLVITAKY